MAQGMRHKDSRNRIHRGSLDIAVLSSLGGRAGCRIDQRKGREEHNGEEKLRVGCQMADVTALVRIAQGNFPTTQRRQTDKILTRHRDTLSCEASSIVLRMQKAMQQMNVKLILILSDIRKKSGMRIIEAILAGERAPRNLPV